MEISDFLLDYFAILILVRGAKRAHWGAFLEVQLHTSRQLVSSRVKSPVKPIYALVL